MQKYKMPISRLRMMVCLIGMLLPMCMFAQQITVQGVVKDQTGETVIGASVMEKGTTFLFEHVSERYSCRFICRL